jgi:hypothetical protein
MSTFMALAGKRNTKPTSIKSIRMDAGLVVNALTNIAHAKAAAMNATKTHGSFTELRAAIESINEAGVLSKSMAAHLQKRQVGAIVKTVIGAESLSATGLPISNPRVAAYIGEMTRACESEDTMKSEWAQTLSDRTATMMASVGDVIADFNTTTSEIENTLDGGGDLAEKLAAETVVSISNAARMAALTTLQGALVEFAVPEDPADLTEELITSLTAIASKLSPILGVSVVDNALVVSPEAIGEEYAPKEDTFENHGYTVSAAKDTLESARKVAEALGDIIKKADAYASGISASVTAPAPAQEEDGEKSDTFAYLSTWLALLIAVTDGAVLHLTGHAAVLSRMADLVDAPAGE